METTNGNKTKRCDCGRQPLSQEAIDRLAWEFGFDVAEVTVKGPCQNCGGRRYVRRGSNKVIAKIPDMV